MTTLQSTILKTDKNLQWALEECTLLADKGVEIARHTIQGNMEIVCDGSLQQKLGTSAGISKGPEEEEGYKFHNRVPGGDSNQSSYQSELCSILGHVIFINAVAKYHDIQEGQVTIGCNNEAIWEALG